MKSLLAITLPVSLFIAQAWFSFELGLSEVSSFYFIFLGSYFLGSGLALIIPARRHQLNTLTPAFSSFAKAFVVLKIVLTAYFFLIFTSYFMNNGYANIRQYMTTEEVKGNLFYFAPFMYVDAYIMYPLNYIVLVALYLRSNRRLFCILLSCIALHTVVFYASRMIFYNAIILVLFAALYKRGPILKIMAATVVAATVVLAVSSLLLFQRDAHFEYEGLNSLADIFLIAVGNYHVIPPVILDAINKESAYFKSNIGYGIATFGFLLDPIISLIPVGDAKSLMASKILSAEAQNFIINIDGAAYNAFATFLYVAVFDFGKVAGPAIYGIFFGLSITLALRRRDAAGFLAFVILSYFVYFNSFTFFITGDWFWVLLFIGVFFAKRNPVRRSTPASALVPATALA